MFYTFLLCGHSQPQSILTREILPCISVVTLPVLSLETFEVLYGLIDVTEKILFCQHLTLLEKLLTICVSYSISNFLVFLLLAASHRNTVSNLKH